jgi:hypothetical protein
VLDKGMKIIITENQYKMLLESNTESIQSLIDIAFQSLKDDSDNGLFIDGYVEDTVYVTEEIKVVDVQKVTGKDYLTGKESSHLFVTIDVYVETIFNSMDVGEMVWELEMDCEKIVGKNNIRLNLREVINTNTNRQW